MTDIFPNWRPTLEDIRFQRGRLSVPFWEIFIEFVGLCHASKYYDSQKREDIRNSKNTALKSHEAKEYLKSAATAETLYFRQKFLAAEKCFEMAAIASNEAETSIIEKIFLSAGLSRTNTSTGHQNANFAIFALREFSFDIFLS